jgi:hypothetical protein
VGLKEGEMIMKSLIGFAAILFATSAFAQSAAAPKVGNKPLVQVKPQAAMGCKFVGTVKGTKLWAGDCVAASEVMGATPAADTAPQSSPAQATDAIPSAEKQ